MELTDQDRKALEALAQELKRRDKNAHQELIREFKKHVNYWSGFQRLFWDRNLMDWRVATHVSNAELEQVGADRSDFGRVVNIIKPHGESIGAALSAALPIVHFAPMDADSPDDISTSIGYTKASDLIDRHNNARHLQAHGMFILWNQSFIAAYNYNDADESYGTYSVEQYGKEKVATASYNCPGCMESGDNAGLISSQRLGEGETPQPIDHNCENCGYQGQVDPTVEETEEMIQLEDKFYPKTKECIEYYGRLNVQIPINIKKLIDSPYLSLERDQHYALMRKRYPKFASKIVPGNTNVDGNFNKVSRAPVVLNSETQTDYVTHAYMWIRPWALHALPEENEELRNRLEKEYPDGIKLCMVNDMLVEIEHEGMDDHWTITENPFSEHIDADPMVRCLIEIQDSTNDIFTLTEETVRQCIPDTYADPDVLNFELYAKTRKRPGLVYPAKAKPGQNLDQSFVSVKTASLSQEVEMFRKAQEQIAQFVVGDFPQIFGGQSSNETLGQDEMAKGQALQRLSTYWKMYNDFWARVKEKATTEYLNKLAYDEKYVEKMGDGYINIFIRRSELTGKIGNVYSETSEQFPVTWAQKRGLFFQLLSMAKQQFDGAAFSPENTQFVKEMLQLDDFHVPGQADRNRQLSQISELLKAAPMMGVGPDGEDMPMPSIPPDPDIDDNPVCIQTLRMWCVSPAGMDAQVNNQQGYANVRAQLSARLFIEQQKAMEAAAQAGTETGEEGSAQNNPTSQPKNKPNGAIENPSMLPAGGGN